MPYNQWAAECPGIPTCTCLLQARPQYRPPGGPLLLRWYAVLSLATRACACVCVKCFEKNFRTSSSQRLQKKKSLVNYTLKADTKKSEKQRYTSSKPLLAPPRPYYLLLFFSLVFHFLLLLCLGIPWPHVVIPNQNIALHFWVPAKKPQGSGRMVVWDVIQKQVQGLDLRGRVGHCLNVSDGWFWFRFWFSMNLDFNSSFFFYFTQ